MPRGWPGVWLDVPAYWQVVAELVADAYRAVGPQRPHGDAVMAGLAMITDWH